MKTIVFVAAIVGVLSSCTINPHPMDMTQAVQSARTRSDHESLATHYEQAAKEMQAKVAAHKKMLAQYDANRGINAREAQNLISHCEGLIRAYERAATENLNMAKSHRQLAAEAK